MTNLENAYVAAFNEAIQMLEMMEDLEIRSALKQSAWDNGIEEVQSYVEWAEKILFAQ